MGGAWCVYYLDLVLDLGVGGGLDGEGDEEVGVVPFIGFKDDITGY